MLNETFSVIFKHRAAKALNERRVSRVQKGESKRSCRDLRYPRDSRGGALGHPVNCGDPKFFSIVLSRLLPKTIFLVHYTLGQKSNFGLKFNF